RWPLYLGESLDSTNASLSQISEKQSKKPSEALTRGLSKTLSLLTVQGIRVLIVGATPEFKYHVPNCILRYPPSRCRADRSFVDQLLSPSMAALRGAVAGFGEVHLLDPISVFCGDETCEPIRNGAVFFRDSNHLSKRGAKLMGPSLDPE